jgi:excisionase family DNA binding protein
MAERKSAEEKIDLVLQKLENLSTFNKAILSFEEALLYLSVSRSYLYKLTFKNKITFYKPTGKLIFFKKEDLDAWLLQNRKASEAEIQLQAENFQFTKHNKNEKHKN